MTAVILAGGESSSLKPLTCTKPASMLEVCGVPLAEYALNELKRNGVKNIVISADRFSEGIAEYFDDGREYMPGFSVTSSGTASSEQVSKAVREFDVPDDEDVVIIKGDVLAEHDIRGALSLHRKKGADITLAVRLTDTPEKFIAAVSDEESLKELVPYPPRESCDTGMMVTGTVIIRSELAQRLESFGGDYILNGIGGLLKEGAKAVLYEEKGYYGVLEEPSDIIKLNRHVMEGAYPYRLSEILYEDDGRFKGVNAEFPVYIGKNTVISEGTAISAFTAVGDNVFIGRNVKLRECAVGDGCYIGESAKINGGVIGENVRVSSEAAVYEGAAVGGNAVIGAGAAVCSGAGVWSRRRVEPYAEVKERVRRGDVHRFTLDDDGITGEINTVITPASAAAAGVAAASLGKRIAVGFKGGAAAFSFALAFASGVSSAGSEAWFVGEVTEPELASCVRVCGAGAGCFIDAGVSVRLGFFSSDGLPLSRSEERILESGLNKGICRRASADGFGEIRQCSGVRELYFSRLLKKRPTALSGIRAVVNTPSGRTGDICRRILDEINDKSGEPVVFHISGDGSKVSAYTDETGYVPQEKLVMLGCMYEFENGRDVSLPFSFPRAADVLGEKYGRKVFRYAHCSDGSDRQARRLAAECSLASDGILLMLKVTELLSQKGMSLKELCGLLPDFASVSRYVAVDAPRRQSMELLRKIEGGRAAGGDGIVINSGKGRVIVRPVKTGRGIMMFAESFNMEAASELCDDFQERIKSISKF
ncbi:MAG: NTP transferase domain-containing protein [Oscillospiraceae bacterium]|nr:NTP transferase domain-containing protein [Oscillospiraceae bacterium]